MIALRIPEIGADLVPRRPAAPAPPAPDDRSPARTLARRIFAMADIALASPSADAFLEASRSAIGSFNGLLVALLELAVEQQDALLDPADVAREAGARLGEDWSESIELSTSSIHRAWAVHVRLFGDERAVIGRGLGTPVHAFASFVLWHAWALTCVEAMLAKNFSPQPEVAALVLDLLRQSGRNAYAALRAIELEQEDEDVEPEAVRNPEIDELEQEAQLQAEEALAEAEKA